MSELIFDVVRPFDYGGEKKVRGDEWSPAGGKWDEQIIDQEYYVKPRNPLAEQHRQTRIRVASERIGRTVPAFLVSHNLTMKEAQEMTDEELLALNGIGPARLKEIRDE